MKKINFKTVFVLFILFSILDMITTAGFVGKWGIDWEGNPIARFFMYNLGIVNGLILHRIIVAIPIFVSSYYIVKWMEKLSGLKYLHKVFVYVFFIIYTVVCILNFLAWKI